MLRKGEIRRIYKQGVAAVERTIRQLYEMLEADDKRIHRLVSSATAAQLKKIEELTSRITHLEAELLNRKRQIHRLELRVEELNRQHGEFQHTIKDLNKQLKAAREQTRLAREAHLATVIKNSQNSSLPPSADRHKRARSLRQKSGKKVGGQTGHPGATLEFVAQPDRIIIHAPESCHLCGASLKGSEALKAERRQVHDLPPLKIEVTEHQAQTIICQRCGVKNKAEFSSGVNAPVQYGERVKSVGAYLMSYQLLPYDRCAETMDDLFSCPLSVGTLTTLLKECSREMVEPLMLIKEGLRSSEVLGIDETNVRVSHKDKIGFMSHHQII